MPRRARLSAPGQVFHLVSRFARDDWWLDKWGARAAYLQGVERALQQCDAEVLAYCLMSNHVHLVVVQGEIALERFTKSVHTYFAGWIGKRWRPKGKSLGPIFADRPRIVLVDRDAYLLHLVRYVHNNPVRAGLVKRARQSDWSSHQAYIGRTSAPTWLRIGYVLDRFGKRASSAMAKFDAFVDEGRVDSRRPDLSGALDASEASLVRKQFGDGFRVSDGILGDEEFIRRVLSDFKVVDTALSSYKREIRRGAAERPRLRRVWEQVLESLEIDVIAFELRPRAARHVHAKRMLMWLWVREYGGKQIDVARFLGITTASASGLYGYVVRNAGDFDTEGSAIAIELEKRSGKRSRRDSSVGVGVSRVRYHVDVDEDLIN